MFIGSVFSSNANLEEFLTLRFYFFSCFRFILISLHETYFLPDLWSN